MDIMFAVKLLEVPPIKELSGPNVFELMGNCRHIKGDYWIYEGDEDALMVEAKVVDEGITGGHGDMDDEEFVAHCCEEVFPAFATKIEDSKWWYEMLSDLRR